MRGTRSHRVPLARRRDDSTCARKTSNTGWLEELVAPRSKDLAARRKEAFCAVERVLAAYERTGSQPESVIPPKEL